MSLQLLLGVAVLAMVALAILRVVRVRLDRSPLPDAKGLFILGFLVVPPIALAAFVDPTIGALAGVPAVPLYAVLITGLVVVMWAVSLVVDRLPPGPWRSRALVALTGDQGDVDDVPVDPPVKAALAASIAVVDEANRAFARGRAFPAEVDRPGFRSAWEALERASDGLESLIAAERRQGFPVASAARLTAEDARSRLDTLRRLAGEAGQAWAT